MTRRVGIIGVPSSAGAFAPGQERAPQALRDAGLVASLEQAGLEPHDRGDCPLWRWRPDRERPRAQNLAAVVEIVRDTAARVTESAGAGELTLVLGGDCTVGIGTVAGHVASGQRVGLVYLDAHADLNVPDSVREGALDWMGMAHMLGQEGAAPELAAAGDRTPLLEGAQVVLLGWDPMQATQFEQAALERLGMAVVPLQEVRDDPYAAVRRARELLPCERLLVHFDVDVIDFTDMPLSENTGRNEGLPYLCVRQALTALLEDRRLAAVTVTELNPDHAESAASLEDLAGWLARALARSSDAAG